MKRIAIIGSGPAGLFCADRLADVASVTIYEAGRELAYRKCPEKGCECKVCHILEGEGGAGGFSDGKNTYSLTRGTQMEEIFRQEDEHWLKYIDTMTIKYGCEGVWSDPIARVPKPFIGSPLEFTSYALRHVGTDGIRKFISGFTSNLKDRGVKIRYNAHVRPLVYDGGLLVIEGNKGHPYDSVIIAAGLQGIPWVENFMNNNASELRSGPAGFGLRMEVDASVVEWLHKEFYDYKIVYKHSSGITIRSFCCNQNGIVVNERHTDLGVVNVNGHSYLDPSLRTKSSNLSIMAKIPSYDMMPTTPQMFVRDLGLRITNAAGGSAFYPVKAFLGDRGVFDDKFMTNHQAKLTNIANIISSESLDLYHAFADFLFELNKVSPGVISDTSVLYAPEIKYYGRRVNVDNHWMSQDIEGMYIIGSCSGYLDSFVAAALSGIVAAEDIKDKEVARHA